MLKYLILIPLIFTPPALADTLSATNPATQNISASSLPLPTAAATSTKQSDGTQKTQVVDGSGNVIGSTSNAINVNLSSGGFATSSNQTAAQTSLSSIATNSGNGATSANQTNGAQLTRITNGTQSADTVAGDTGQNSLIIAGARKEVIYTNITSFSSWIDVSNYKSFSFHITAQSGFCVVQQANDQSSPVGTTLWADSTAPATISNNSGALGFYVGAVRGRWLRISPGTSVTGILELYASPLSPQSNSFLSPNGAFTVVGANASGSAVFGNPLRVASKALTANSNVTTGQTADLISTLAGAIIQKPYSIPEADWSYPAATGGITNTTTAVTIAAAAGAGLRNYVTGCDITSTALGVGTELAIRDGASGTVIWRIDLTTSGLSGFSRNFTNPIKSSANNLLEVVTLTASMAGSVYVNCQGYIAP